MRAILKDTLIAVIVLSFTFAACLILRSHVERTAVIPLVFNLAVFLISSFSGSYLIGIGASFVSVLAVNYAFTFPYYGFTIFENLISVVAMLVVTIMTGMMTTKIRLEEPEKSKNQTPSKASFPF